MKHLSMGARVAAPLVPLVLGAAFGMHGAAAQDSGESPIRILEHDTVSIAVEASEGYGLAEARTGAMDMTLHAMGQTFDIELRPNDKVLENLPRSQREAINRSVQLYRGRLRDEPDSWVRLSRRNGRYTGMIFDGFEIYVLDTASEVAGALEGGRLRSQDYTLAYRLADMDMDKAQCALDPGARPVNDYRGLVRHLGALAAPPLNGPEALEAASRQLNVAVVADRAFTSANGGNARAAVAARMNVVDGIFSSQVGVQLNVSEIRTLSDNGGLTSTSASTLLNQFQTYTNAPGFNNPGLAHLFTGRNLNGSTAGIAYLGVLCNRRVGIGLSQVVRTGTAGALIVAHEIGHNFGAPHDNQGGSPCASTPGSFLMNPSINGSDEFSSCSRQRMRPNVEQAACIIDTPDADEADLRVTLSSNSLSATVGQRFNLGVEVRNIGDAAATGSEVDVTVPAGLRVVAASVSGRSCGVAARSANCDLGAVGAGGDVVANVTLEGTAAGQYLAGVAVSANNDINSANNSTRASVTISSGGGGGGGPSKTLIGVNFNTAMGGFSFRRGITGATSARYSRGDYSRTLGFRRTGTLRVLLGGIDGADVTNMSGGFERSFTLRSAADVTLQLSYRMALAANYERDEYVDAIVQIDGRTVAVNGVNRLARLRGDGNGGPLMDTRWKSATIDLGRIPAGTHTLTLGAVNNKKTFTDESAELRLDNVFLKTR